MYVKMFYLGVSVASFMMFFFVFFPVFATAKDIPSITAKEYVTTKIDENAVLIDVRTQEEWNEGHVAGAVHIDVKGKDFVQKIQALPKNTQYYVYCRSGKRSVEAIRIMNTNGIHNTVTISDGMQGFSKTSISIKK